MNCQIITETNTEVNISISSNKIIFFIENVIFISKLIDGSFPDYKGLYLMIIQIF